MKLLQLFTLSLFVGLLATTHAETEKRSLTNDDVIKLVKAQLPESAILLTIQASPHAFDTSPDGLIALKSAGVTEKVLDAILQPSATPALATGAVAAPAGPTTAGPMTPWGSKQTRIEVDRVLFIDGTARQEMKYTRPSTRTRFNPFGGAQQFAVIPGTRSALRTANRNLIFEMILPSNIQPASVLAMARLGERSNGTREILIGGGYLSFSAGLPKDRNVALSVEKAADQSQAPDGYEVFQIKPAMALIPGEYAFMVAKGSGDAAGVFGTGANANYNFYEFAVD